MIAVAWDSPLFWAVLIGWIVTVVVHEFAHGVVAHFGGDYTIRERGGLSLNPLNYIDPVTSLILPAVFLLLGGIPLPGGSTYIRRDLLRSRYWDAAVSLAGPAANLLIGIGLCLLLHPRFGPLRIADIGPEGSGIAAVVATLAFLQLFAVLLNLLPIPPLDGFQTIAAFLPESVRSRLLSPAAAQIGFLLVFLVLWQNRAVFGAMMSAIVRLMMVIGLDGPTIRYTIDAMGRVLFGG